MSINTLPDLEFLRQLFICDAAAGKLTWCERPREHFATEKTYKMWNTKHSGKTAGWKSYRLNTTYVEVGFDGKSWKAHRIIWKMHYGEEPPDVIDHIDGDGTNNRIENLRKATKGQNIYNSKIRRDNTTGYKGVWFYKRYNKWMTSIKSDNKSIFLGYFDTAEEAHAAYQKAAAEYHGEFRSKS